MAKATDIKEPRFDETTLTKSDEKALDEAWNSITDADIEASIRWLDGLPSLKKSPKENHSNGR